MSLVVCLVGNPYTIIYFGASICHALCTWDPDYSVLFAAKVPKRKPHSSHPRDMDSNMELLSGLLEVGKMASCTKVNLGDFTARVSEDPVLLEIHDETYEKPLFDSEGPARSGDVVNINLGEKKKRQPSKKSKH